MRVKRCIESVTALIMLAALAACGGGGSSSGGSSVTDAGTNMGGSVQGKTLLLTNGVSSFAGTSGSTDGAGAAARFRLPHDVASDGTSVFVADTGNSTIRRIVIATGATSTLAGSAGVTGSSDGTGSAARFNFPAGIAISKDKGTLYVSDSGNNTVRSINISSGAVSTLAGTANVVGNLDGTGALAQFSSPTGITTDGANLYLADRFNHGIRKIAIATGAVTTLAGNGAQGFTDGTGAAASFNEPYGIAIAPDGSTLYLTDYGNSAIRSIAAATGAVTTLAGPGAGLVSPTGITTDGTSLYLADAGRNLIRKLVIDTLALSTIAGDAVNGTPGSTDGAGGTARFNVPGGLTMDGANLYLADSQNGTIRKIVQSGVVSTLAGSASSADATGSAAGFNSPFDITTDGTSLYVADSGNNTIRRIVIATGAVTTLAGSAGVTGSADGAGTSASFNLPSSITTDGSSLFVADTGNNTIRRISISSGTVTTLAGSAGAAGSADGAGTAARFNGPAGITTDGTSLFISDTGNNAIRRIVIATGAVSTLAGSAAGLNTPYGITTDGANLFVADAGNSAIRKISISTGAISTLALTGGAFNFPTGITSDGANLYVADSGDRTIRKIVISTGAVSTVAAGPLQDPNGITTDGTSLFVADAHDGVIVRIN